MSSEAEAADLGTLDRDNSHYHRRFSAVSNVIPMLQPFQRLTKGLSHSRVPQFRSFIPPVVIRHTSYLPYPATCEWDQNDVTPPPCRSFAGP